MEFVKCSIIFISEGHVPCKVKCEDVVSVCWIKCLKFSYYCKNYLSKIVNESFYGNISHWELYSDDICIADITIFKTFSSVFSL